MPIYEYRCSECHQVFEEWTKHIEDSDNAVCPVCDSRAERIMSNTSFVLKGGGWYVTDYGYKKDGKTDSSVSAGSSESSASSAPAAPAAASSAPAAPAAGTGAA